MSALIVVNYQNDFALPTGALYVQDAEAALSVINDLRKASWKVCYLSADRDADSHPSFHDNNPGTTLFSPFPLPDGEEQIVAYSAFSGRCHRPDDYGTLLFDSLKNKAITKVTVCGLATDYCVKVTALDAARLGFETTVILPACRGVAEDTTAAAIAEMAAAGILIENVVPAALAAEIAAAV